VSDGVLFYGVCRDDVSCVFYDVYACVEKLFLNGKKSDLNDEN